MCVDEIGSQQVRGQPYNPQAQGKVERENQTIKNMLKRLIMEDKGGLQPEEASQGTSWAIYLPKIIAMRNSSPRRSLLGQTPYFMMHGKHSPYTVAAAAGVPLPAVNPLLHAALMVKAAEFQRKSKEQSVAARMLKKPPTVFEVGDKVFVCPRPTAFASKLICKWSHFGVVMVVEGRRNSYRVRYMATGGPYGEKEGDISKLLPAKRLKKCSVTTSNAAFCKLLRLPYTGTAGLSGDATPPTPEEEDDLNAASDDGLDEEEVDLGVEDVEMEAYVSDAEEEVVPDIPAGAGATRSVFPADSPPDEDAEYLFGVLDAEGKVVEVCRHSCWSPQ